MEYPREDSITNPDKGTDHHYRDAHSPCIRDELLLRGPGHLFHLSDDFVYELLYLHFTSPYQPCTKLLRFLVSSMLLAELAVLVELQTIRVVLLVLVGAVVAVMANRALKRDIIAHLSTPLTLFGLSDANSAANII